MFNIFTSKKGKHEARHFSSKYRRALVAAALITCALLTSVSAAMIMSRDTMTALSPTDPAEPVSAAADIGTSGRVSALLRSKAFQNALQAEKNGRTADESNNAIDTTDNAAHDVEPPADEGDVSDNASDRTEEIIERAAPIRPRSLSERLSRALRAIAMSRAVREELSEHSTVAYADQAITVFTPKGQFPGQTRLEDGTALVDAIGFARFVGDCDISREGDCIYMRGSAHDVSIPLGTEYLTSSGRVFWARRIHTADEDCVFVPLDTLARAFGLDCTNDGEGYAVRLSTSGNLLPGESFYREDEVYWLSRIIQAESRGECLEGKIAVGNVVLNRVRDKRFPNTIYGVIFDRSCGVQFTPSANGTVYLEPCEESVIAAKICLEGYSISDEITFFFNPSISQNTWISDNRQWVCTIGNHAFYS